MKVLYQNYNFNAATQQITFNTTENVELENILLITNVTDNVIIYNFANPSLGGTISNNVLTLNYDTTLMSNTDSLQIFLDLYGTPATEDSIQYLKKIVQLLTPLATQDSSQRQRISLDASPATVTVAQATAASLNATVVGTVTSNIGTGTLAAVTNVSQFAGVDVRYQFTDAARLTYAQGIRRNLQFS